MPTANRLKSQSSLVTTDIQAENKVDAPYIMKLFRRTLYQTKSRFVRASIYPRKLKLVPDYEASDIIFDNLSNIISQPGLRIPKFPKRKMEIGI
jgi:hypothetical protein